MMASTSIRRLFHSNARRSPSFRLFSSSSADFLPLSGVRVLDFSRILAGPYCTQLLGDSGAEIIKVEHPERGDDTRQWGPPFAENSNGTGPRQTSYFLSANRNKKSIGIDVQSKEGIEIVKRLVEKCDILIENFVPGKMADFGLSYEECSRWNPGLIYISISGSGDSGPLKYAPGYDLMAAARGGLIGITGPDESAPSADGRPVPPVKVGVAITDICTGLFSASGILAALYKRTKTGRGCYITNSLLETQLAVLANIGQNSLVTGKNPQRRGTRHESIVPYQAFQDQNGEFFVLGALNNKQFHALAECLGKGSEWIEKDRESKMNSSSSSSSSIDYSTNPKRVENYSSLITELQFIFSKQSKSYWLSLFEKAQIPSAPVNSLSEAFKEPQTRYNQSIIQLNHSTIGKVSLINSPLKMYQITPERGNSSSLSSSSSSSSSSNRPFLPSHPENPLYSRISPQESLYTPPPILNEHTEEILKNLLNYSEEEIQEFQRNKIVGKKI